MTDKKRISLPIIVEGRYDKSTLSSMFDCNVISVGGFGVFNSKEKQMLLRRICADGAVILTDSDGGGVQIRSFLSGILPKDKIHHAYIPKVEGKERRKQKAGKAGLLGVEGMSRDVLERALAPFIEDGGRVKAYLRSFYDDADSVKIGRVLTLAHGEGLGRELMVRSIDAIKEKMPTHLIYLNSQEHAVGFYEKLGFEVVSDVFYEEHIPHVRMELK